MAKIKLKTPAIELDGDEMIRIIRGFIKDKLILPYLDADLKFGREQKWLNTQDFLAKIDSNLQAAMKKSMAA